MAILLNTYGEENCLSPSAITTVSWHSRRLIRRLRWIPLPFITMQQYWLVPFVYVSRQIPCNSPCMPRVYTREGFEFEFCPVGGSVTGIWVREILVRGTKIFSGKLVRPDRFFREKWSASGKLVRIMVRP